MKKNIFYEFNTIDSLIDEDANKKIYDFEKGEGWLQDTTINREFKEPIKSDEMYQNNEFCN